MTAVIAAHSQELFVKRNIWARFHQILQDLKREKKVQDEDITMLFYQNYIEEVLLQFDRSEVDEITTKFVLDEIEKASKLEEKEKERRFRGIEQDFIKNLEKDTYKKAEENKDKEWSEKVQEIRKSERETAEDNMKRNLERKAKTYSEKGSKVLSFFISIILVFTIIKLYLVYGVKFLSIITPISFLFGGIGIFGILKLQKYIENLLFKWTYKKMLGGAGLYE